MASDGIGDIGGSVASMGLGAATGNPFAVLSGALSVFGKFQQMGAAKKQAEVAKQQAESSMEVAKLEQKQNEQRKQQMILMANRQQMQTIRNTQLARSMALTSSTAQGAQFGSGLAGGYGQISGDSNTNMLGVNQNLEIGKNIFDLDSKISDQKIRQAQLGGQMANYQGQGAAAAGLSSLGTSLGSLSKDVQNLSSVNWSKVLG